MTIQRATFIRQNSDGTVSVRLPISNSIVDAYVCCQPGVIPEYKANDILFVYWLGTSEYVILGKQFNPLDTVKVGSIRTGSVYADGGELTGNIRICNVQGSDLLKIKSKAETAYDRTNIWRQA